MVMEGWVLWLLEACIPGVVVGVIMLIINAKRGKKVKEEEDKEIAARRKDSLEISLLVATAELSYALVMAMKRGTPNGEVETALARYNSAMEKFRDFEREQLGYVD